MPYIVTLAITAGCSTAIAAVAAPYAFERGEPIPRFVLNMLTRRDILTSDFYVTVEDAELVLNDTL